MKVPGGCNIHTCKLLSGFAENLVEHLSMTEDSFIHEHLQTLYFITREFKCKKVLELGTGAGESTNAFIQALREIGGHITSIDIKQQFNGKNNEICTYIEADSTSHDLHLKVKGRFDILFIDSLHTTKQLTKELLLWEPKVRKGGFIIIHDIINPYHPYLSIAIQRYFVQDKNYTHYRWFNNNGLQVIRKK